MELSINRDGVVSAREIAEKYAISEHHVAKVLQQLVRARFAKSLRGVGGGFQIDKDPKDITMLDIVELFEPPHPQSEGYLPLDFGDACNLKEVCRIAEVFNEIQEQAFYTLKSISIATLIFPKKLSE